MISKISYLDKLSASSASSSLFEVTSHVNLQIWNWPIKNSLQQPFWKDRFYCQHINSFSLFHVSFCHPTVNLVLRGQCEPHSLDPLWFTHHQHLKTEISCSNIFLLWDQSLFMALNSSWGQIHHSFVHQSFECVQLKGHQVLVRQKS